MIGQEKIENKDFLERSVDYLSAKGFDNIKADLDGYDSPTSFVKQSNGQNITPDITATKNGRKYFFDVSLKSEKATLLKSKWKLLDTVARLKSNRFRVITTRGHVNFTDNLLKEMNLDKTNLIRI